MEETKTQTQMQTETKTKTQQCCPPLDHPVYTSGSVSSASNFIDRIKERHQQYGEGKYINAVGSYSKDIDLTVVNEAFPNHTITECSYQKAYYYVRPKST